MWRATLKSLLARKLRLALTAMSIVLGVGFIAGTFVLTDTMNKAFDDLFTQASRGTDVVVRSVSAFTPSQQGPGGGGGDQRSPVPASLLATVQAVPGVKLADGLLQGYAQMEDPKTGDAIGGTGPPTIGLNWATTSVGLELRSGSRPQGPDEVAVDAGTARKFDITVGETIRILFQGPSREFRVVGIAGFGTADNLAGATLALFDTSTAQQVLGKEGQFDEIDVVAATGVDATDLRTRIQSVLPDRTEAVTASTVADEQSKALKQALGFFRTALLVFAFIALFVGAFNIFNTFSIIVSQRSREMALLRVLGASSRQVLSSVIVEAFVVGIVASLLGVVAGIGIAIGLKGLLSAFGVDLPSTTMQIAPRTIVVSLVVGTIVTAASSILPARRAARVAPLQALRESHDAVAGTTRRRLLLGLAVTGLGVLSLAVGLFGHISNAIRLIGVGAALTFVGVAMLSPLAARPVAGFIGSPLRRLGIQGKLGRENAMRNPRRTASTASALMIGLGLVAMVAILSASLKASFDVTINQALKADFTLTTSSLTAFSPQVATDVRNVQGVGAVAEFRQGGFRVQGSDAFLTAVDPATVEQVTDLKLSPGATDALGRGDVLVFKDVADTNGWTTGDTVPAAFATTGRTPLTVGGTFDENRLVGGDYLVSIDTYEKYFTEQLDSFVMVRLAPGANALATQHALESATKDFGNVKVENQVAFRDQQAGFVNQLLGLVTALLTMAILVALFGIANTLGLSVFERTRELGLLRAVGMSRRQVKRMVRWESVIIAVFGALLGVAVGIGFGWSLQRALMSQGVTELKIPVGQLVAYVAIAGVVGVIAAIVPARRASKLNVLDAISYE